MDHIINTRHTFGTAYFQGQY